MNQLLRKHDDVRKKASQVLTSKFEGKVISYKHEVGFNHIEYYNYEITITKARQQNLLFIWSEIFPILIFGMRKNY